MEAVREYVWASPARTTTLRDLARKYGVTYEAMRRAFIRWVIDWLDRRPDEFKDRNGRYIVPATFEDWLENSRRRTPRGVARELGVSLDLVYRRFKEWCRLRGLNPEDFRNVAWVGEISYTYILPEEFIAELREEAERYKVAKERLKRALEIIRRKRPDASEETVRNILYRRFQYWCRVRDYVPDKAFYVYVYPEEFLEWLEEVEG